MTTSSKTNMNEDLKKEFEKKFSRGSYWFFETDEGVEKLLKWIQTAISKAREEEREKIKKDFKKIIKGAKENNSYDDYTDDAYYAIKDIENDFLNKLNNEKDSV